MSVFDYLLKERIRAGPVGRSVPRIEFQSPKRGEEANHQSRLRNYLFRKKDYSKLIKNLCS
jgi:hypothetical protein